MASASKDAISAGHFLRGVKHRTVGIVHLQDANNHASSHTNSNITVNSYKPRCVMETADTAAYAIYG